MKMKIRACIAVLRGLLMIISISIIFLLTNCIPVGAIGEDNKANYFTFDGSSGEIKILMQAVFNDLKSSGILSSGFPVYSKTEVVGEYREPHTLKAIPVASIESADSILINDNKFITFKVWGLNQRGVSFTDFVYLLREKDEEAIRNGLKGVRQYKYVEICYMDLMPTTKDGFIGGDFSQANKVISSVRQGLLKATCKKTEIQPLMPRLR